MVAEHECTEKATLARIQKDIAEDRKETKEIRDDIKTLSKKLFTSNGDRALVEIIRDNTQGRKRLEDLVTKHLEEAGKPVKTVREVRIGKTGFSIKGYTGADLTKIALVVVLIGYVVWNDHGDKVVQKISSALAAEATPENPE